MSDATKKFDFTNAYFKDSDYTSLGDIAPGHLIRDPYAIHEESDQKYDDTTMFHPAMVVAAGWTFDPDTLNSKFSVTLMDEYGRTETKTMSDVVHAHYSRRTFTGHNADLR